MRVIIKIIFMAFFQEDKNKKSIVTTLLANNMPTLRTIEGKYHRLCVKYRGN